MKTAVSYAGQDAKSKLHSKIAEVEQENSAVEAAHKTEQKAETLVRYSVRTAKYIDGKRKAAPYQKAARLQHTFATILMCYASLAIFNNL